MLLRLLVICVMIAAFLFLYQAWQEGDGAVELYERVRNLL
jgi:hypothetical protein